MKRNKLSMLTKGSQCGALFNDINSEFKNKHSSHICFIENNNDENNNGDNGGVITLTESQLNDIVATAVTKANEAFSASRGNGNENHDEEDHDEEESELDKVRREKAEAEAKAKELEQFGDARVFNRDADAFVHENKSFLSSDLQYAITQTREKEKDPIVLASKTKLLIAKSYLTEERIKELPESERAFAEKVRITPEQYIPEMADDAFKLVKDAIFYSKQNSRRNFGGNSDSDIVRAPAAKSFIDRAISRKL